MCAFLDLFLAPVFNDEDMTAEEYVEMVGTVYGSEVGKEISSDEINAEDFSVTVTMPVVDWTTFPVEAELKINSLCIADILTLSEFTLF